MASIRFEGPNPSNLSERSEIVVNLSDEALLAVVQAFCELEGYNPEIHDGPGIFTIQKTLDFWTQKAEYNIKKKASIDMNVIVDEQIAPLRNSITLE
jgi:hypothetical protein